MKDRFRANLVGKNSWLRLFLMAIPVIIWMVSTVVYESLIKTRLISYYDSVEMIGASFAGNYFVMLSTIPLTLFAVAASSLISRAIGSGRAETVKRVTTDSFIFIIPLCLIIPVIGLLAIGPYMLSNGFSDTIGQLSIASARVYLFIWYLGMPLLAISLVGSYALLAAGNGWLPSLIAVFTILLNGLLDFVLITGVELFPGLGLKGAAIAALLARGATAFLPLLVLIFYYNMLTFKIPKMADFFSSLLNLLYIWLPALVIQLAFWGFYSFIHILLAKEGTMGVAATSIARTIKMLAMTPIMALPMVFLPFLGQNMGAGSTERAVKGFHIFNIVSLAAGVFLAFSATLFYILFGKIVSGSFSETEMVLQYLIIISLSIGAEGVLMNSNMLFYAARKPLWALLINLAGLLVLMIPLSWLGFKIQGTIGLGVGGSLASLLIAGLAWLVGWFVVRKVTGSGAGDGKNSITH